MYESAGAKQSKSIEGVQSGKAQELLMIQVVSQVNVNRHTTSTTWMLEWQLGGKGIRQDVCFFTEGEARAALESIQEYCAPKGIEPSELPRSAIVIMLDALCRGLHPIHFIPSRALGGQSIH